LKKRSKIGIGGSIIVGLVVIYFGVISSSNDFGGTIQQNESETIIEEVKNENTILGDVSESFPKIPDADWTVTDKDVAEVGNAFTDRYGILEGESWRYYNQNNDLQIFVGVMKIDNSKNPKDYFDFQQDIISKTENVGSMLIFDENALNSIDSEKCSGQKQAYNDGSIIFYILCQKENFVFQITTSTYKDDLVEEYGIDFANQVSIKIP